MAALPLALFPIAHVALLLQVSEKYIWAYGDSTQY